MLVAEAVGRCLAALGVDHVFGVVGSGNFHVTNGLVAGGARFVAARHEGGAATMADAFARVSGRVAAVSVHQGPGLTNAMTGVTEAAKSRTPLLVLTAEATHPRSNFHIDQPALATAVGATSERIRSPETAVTDAAHAYRLALTGRRTVVLNLPLELEHAPYPEESLKIPTIPEMAPPPAPDGDSVAALTTMLATAHRPVFIAGRGARLSGARDALVELAERCGALLATSAVAKGFFAGESFALDVSGGFATPVAAELISGADLVVGWGCSLTMWTTRHGKLIAPGTTVAQVDLDADAIGAHQPVDLGVTGDVRAVAEAVAAELAARDHRSTGYRTGEVRERLAREGRWRDVSFEDSSDGTHIDPRQLTIALDDLLPAERTVAVDSGNFMGYPSMFLSVPDADGFCFTQAYQSIGLGLASAVGAALARPDRLTVAACGDGGLMMSVAELDTAVRLGLPVVVVVYDDAAYGAEVHHFGPDGFPLDTVRFPDTDLAAVARGFGCAALTVRGRGDLDAVGGWLAGPRDRPLLIDAKVTSGRGSWWLEEAFRGH
jgi:thiamine pyrophosphate-dependent acetolactate synthase large subunit-like protein